MLVGLPGTGIGGLFYLLLTAWMPLHALDRGAPARLGPRPWAFIARQVGLCLGVVATLWGQAWRLRRFFELGAVRRTLGTGDPTRFFGAHTHTYLLATMFGSALSLAAVLIAVRVTALLVRRHDRAALASSARNAPRVYVAPTA